MAAERWILVVRRNSIRNSLERGRRGDHVDVRHPGDDDDRNVYVKALKERRKLICDDLLVCAADENSGGPANFFKIGPKLETRIEVLEQATE